MILNFTGIQGPGSKYPCVYCEGTKSARGKMGWWKLGPLRTPKSMRESHQEWAMKHHGRLDSKKAQEDLRLKYHNTNRSPLRVQPEKDATEMLFILPPDPLHVCLLGKLNYIVSF